MFHTIDKRPSRSIDIDGENYLFFSGTSYLGLANNEAFNALLKQGIDRYGSSFGVSRNGNLRLKIYEKAEQKLADFVGAPAALSLSSGMLAGQALVQYFKQENTHFIYAPAVHPANWHEPNIAIPTYSFKAWSDDLIQNFPVYQGPIIILCNSVDALKMNAFSFDFLNKIPDNQNVTIVIDDSHGLGVMHGGRGIFDTIPKHLNAVVISSLHKAFGIPGGVIFGQNSLIEAISKTVFFSGCSPIAPAYLEAYVSADDLYQNLHQKLKANVSLFREKTDLSIFQFHADHAVFYTENDALYGFLLAQKIFIYSFAYPDINSKPNTRIVLSAWHSEADILQLSAAVNAFVATGF